MLKTFHLSFRERFQTVPIYPTNVVVRNGLKPFLIIGYIGFLGNGLKPFPTKIIYYVMGNGLKPFSTKIKFH